MKEREKKKEKVSSWIYMDCICEGVSDTLMKSSGNPNHVVKGQVLPFTEKPILPPRLFSLPFTER